MRNDNLIVLQYNMEVYGLDECDPTAFTAEYLVPFNGGMHPEIVTATAVYRPPLHNGAVTVSTLTNVVDTLGIMTLEVSE